MNKISISIKNILSVIGCLFMMTGCVEEYEAELPESETHLLVVNGTISSGYSQFHLSWSEPLENANKGKDRKSYSIEDVKPVEHAVVTIHGTDGSEYKCTDDGAEYGYPTGIYSCYMPMLNPDVSYYVIIKCNEGTYRSTPEKPIRTPDIETLEYFQKDSLSDVEVLLTTADPDNPDKTSYFTWDYKETWEIRPTRITSIYFDIETMTRKYMTKDRQYPKRGWKFGRNEIILAGSTIHYAGGRMSKYQLLDIPRDDERVSWYYCFDLTQRAISKAEYEYELACRQAGWEMGGLFTPQPSSFPTNIRCTTSSNRVIGYVGCSLNTIWARMYIDCTKISRILPKPNKLKKLDDCQEVDCMRMTQEGKVLYDWNDGRQAMQPLVTLWGEPEDFDVRLRGATTEKPYYMPPFDE